MEFSAQPSFAAASIQTSLAELRKSFTVGGKPVPPEIFSDLGDSDLADSGSIRVTIDVLAATGSNLYGDDIKISDDWVTQIRRATNAGNPAEETSYRFIGSTANSLLVVIASWSGGGSGTFYTLHIIDAQAGRGYDFNGNLYDRLNLTALRSLILGDRWDGCVKIDGNTIAVTTTGGVPNGHDQKPVTKIIKAERP